MTLAIDATYAVAREPTGVAVYSSQILSSLAQLYPNERFLLAYRPHRFFPALMKPGLGPNCRRYPLADAFTGWLFRSARVFHGLNQRLPRAALPPAVATFHDLFALTGEYSTPDFRERFARLSGDAAARSSHIIAVSQYTAGLVADLLKVERSRITVVHHGLDPIPPASDFDVAEFRRRYELSPAVVLHMGALQRRKNIERLVAAFETLPGNPTLVLAGGWGFGVREIQQRIEASPTRARIRMLGYVDNATRALLYRCATVLAFPSLEEGFGLPVLEAMSAGVPVVTSNRSALPEVAGSAALLVDPLDAESVREGLARLLRDAQLRAGLSRAGLRRAAGFSWAQAARRTWEVYSRLSR